MLPFGSITLFTFQTSSRPSPADEQDSAQAPAEVAAANNPAGNRPTQPFLGLTRFAAIRLYVIYITPGCQEKNKINNKKYFRAFPRPKNAQPPSFWFIREFRGNGLLLPVGRSVFSPG